MFESKIKILLVEDNTITAMLERKILERNNFIVIHADTGEKAIEIINTNNNIDLILMDIDLGIGLNGTETAKEILKHQDIPLIFMSSHSEPEYIQKTENISSYGYILKSSPETIMLASIRMALRLFQERKNRFEKESLLDNMLKLIPDMISIQDTDFNIIYSNWKGIANVPKEKRVLGSKCYETYKNLENICKDCHILEVIKTKKEYHKELKWSDDIWIDLKIIPLLNKNKEIVLIMEWIRDITDEKTLNEELKKFKEISDKANYGIAISDLNGNLSYINDYFAEIHGYSSKELIGSNLSIFHNESQIDEVTSINKELIEKGYFNSKEISHCNKEGHIFTMLMNSIVLKDKQGEPKYLSATAIDISESKKAQMLIKRNLKFQKIISDISTRFLKTNEGSFSNDINFLLKSIGQYFDIERAYLFLFSDDYKSFSNLNEWCNHEINPSKNLDVTLYTDLFPWITTKLLNNEIVKISDVYLLDGEAEKEKAEFISQGIKSLINIPIKSSDRIWGFLGFDSLNRIYTWQESEIENLKLISYIIGELFQKLDNIKKLKNAQEQSEAANKAKSLFLANMSHEIRTPLNSVLGFTELLALTKLTDEQVSFVNHANHSGKILLNIIDKILEFSRIDSQEIQLKYKKENILEIIDSVTKIYELSAKTKNLTFKIQFDNKLPEHIEIDAHHLKIILNNLFENAIKFTDKGEILLTLDYTPKSKDRGNLKFVVKDTGIGIKQEDINTLFTVFNQADNSYTRKYGGTGLGLTIAQNIANKMGSSIIVESNYGEGSKFFFSLDVKTYNNTLLPFNEEKLKENKYTILIAEDNRLNMLVSKRFLNEILPKACILEAKNGLEAIDLTMKHKPDLIFMDIQMPELDGWEATKIIRGNQDTKINSIPIIALTASITIDEIKNYKTSKINDYCSKPINSKKIIDILNRYLL